MGKSRRAEGPSERDISWVDVVREGLLEERQGLVTESHELQVEGLQLLGAVKTCGKPGGVKGVGDVNKAVLGSQAGSDIKQPTSSPCLSDMGPLFSSCLSVSKRHETSRSTSWRMGMFTQK